MSSSTLTQRPTSTSTPRRRRAAAQGRTAWLLAAPFTILFIVFSAGPVITSFLLSFTDSTAAQLRSPLTANFVGVSQYVKLFADPNYRQAFLNTIIFVVVGVPLTMVVGFLLALALNSGINRFRAVFRVGYYTPVVTSIVAVAVVWKFILQPDGLLNTALGWVGLQGPNWLLSTTWALPALIIMGVWRNFGTLMIIFIAGLQTVPTEVIEASKVDGAGSFRRVWSITVPIMRPTILFGSVLTGVGFLQFFDEPYVMTQGGPLNHTLSVALYTYNQFSFGNYGFASASGYVMFAAVVLLTLIQFRFLRERPDR
jgi:multiple sugar transport system permease protein